jgi:xanthine dehydrogenase small subunit
LNSKPLQFIKRGTLVSLPNVAPTRTLLEVLREDLGAVGTKEGCGEGDCGACVVVTGAAVNGKLEFRAINSCIRFAHSIDGMALWTVEDLSNDAGALHPAQQAMVDCHGSQCGFCTPGFVMSLFALYQTSAQACSRAEAQTALAGNLCRCTGYRPILDAAQAMFNAPRVTVDEASMLAKLADLKPQADANYLAPTTLGALVQARAAHPTAQLVAGCTDVGLWVTKQHRQFEQVLDITRTAELKRIETYPHHLAIGAAAPLHEAFAALVTQRPALAEFAARFAGLSVRNSGTLGGNVANGSPIGDSMPLLISLGASVVLSAWRHNKICHRELLLEDLYTGYRTSVLAADEVLTWIKVPNAARGEFQRVYKVSKRFEDDISAVCLSVNIVIDNGVVTHARIGAGGVAATPARARKTEASLRNKPWSKATATEAGLALREEFSPISDMRASAAYRSTVLANLMQRFWLESQGACASLDAFDAFDANA